MSVYVVNSPTLAITLEDGHHLAHTVPPGSLITAVGEKKFEGERLMDVMWAGVQVMMFTHDVRMRTSMVTANEQPAMAAMEHQRANITKQRTQIEKQRTALAAVWIGSDRCI